MIDNLDKLQEVIAEARAAAYAAAERYFQEELGGQDRFACGFAWVNIYEFNGKKLDGRSKMGRMMKQAGVGQDYTRAFQIWNPSTFPCQNVDTLEEGARAAAEVLRKHDFTAYAGSRLD